MQTRLKSGFYGTLILALLWAAPAMFPGTTDSAVTVTGTAAHAEEAKKPAKKKRTRKVPAMREATYKRLSEAQIMIDPESVPREEGEPPPEPKGTPQDAVDLLLSMDQRKGLNSYERAQIWNSLAFAYYTLGDLPSTMKAYENVLNQGTITEALELQALRALFQLYYGEEDYHKSLEFIDKWEAVKGSPDPDVTFIKATAYYQLEDIQESLRNALYVEQLAIEQNRTIKENWWYLQVVLYNQLEDQDNVIRVLETMIPHYPKKQYWMHLAGMYSEKGWDDRALSAYYALYAQGLLGKESEIVQLSQRLLSHDDSPNPYEAAQILEKGLKDEVVERNEKNSRLLATAYAMAQEHNKAIEAWRDTAEFAEDGEPYYNLGQSLASRDRHEEAIDAYRSALKKGDLKSPAEVNFWMGVSQIQLAKWDDAVKSFRESRRLDKEKAEQADRYIRYIASERRRIQALEQALEDAKG